MKDFDHKQLDDVIHSRIRLAVMAVLVNVEHAEFIFLKDRVKTTDGNLSIHLKKLEEAGYVSVEKKFVNRKPVTAYSITEKGRKAFSEYVKSLEKFLNQ